MVETDSGQDQYCRPSPLVYLVNAPNILVGGLLGPHWPQTNNLISDWANLTGAFLTFLWGFIIASNSDFLGLSTHRRREFLITGLAVAILFFTARYYSLRVVGPEPRPCGSGPWSARLWDDMDIRVGRLCARYHYATQPLAHVCDAGCLSLLHLSPDDHGGVCLLRHPWSIGVWPMLAIVTVGTFAGSWLLFEIVRRLSILRPLFGLKASA